MAEVCCLYEHEALVEIETGEIYRGWLPRAAYDLINTPAN